VNTPRCQAFDSAILTNAKLKGFAAKVILLRPRSGLKENNPAL
jgi:hypothetical protein